ncbi:MAG: hypothetical protein ACLPSF_08795 [Methylocella sp.]
MDESGHAANSGRTSPEPSLDLDETTLENAVLQEQIRVLYETHAIVFAHIVNATLTAYVLRDLLPVRILVGWVWLGCSTSSF